MCGFDFIWCDSGCIFQLFDNRTYTYTYLLADKESKKCVLIDPVLELAERDVSIVQDLGLDILYACKETTNYCLIYCTGHCSHQPGKSGKTWKVRENLERKVICKFNVIFLVFSFSILSLLVLMIVWNIISNS